MWYSFDIYARKNGAIGCECKFNNILRYGETEEEAVLRLYDAYEHISVINFHPCTPEEIEEYFKD